jgi:hypothetical protein
VAWRCRYYGRFERRLLAQAVMIPLHLPETAIRESGACETRPSARRGLAHPFLIHVLLFLIRSLTTQHRPGAEPLRIPVSARERLRKECYAMTDQVRALNRSRFGDGPLTTLTAEELAVVERSLKAVLGMW